MSYKVTYTHRVTGATWAGWNSPTFPTYEAADAFSEEMSKLIPDIEFDVVVIGDEVASCKESICNSKEANE